MSNKKHKKRRTKGRTRDFRVPPARGQAGQAPLASSMPPRQAPTTKPGKATMDEGIRRRVGLDLRRSLLSAGMVLSVLAILYFVLR